MPLAWSEHDAPQRPSFRAADFADWRSRLANSKDPWKAIATTRQTITPATLAALAKA
jgi:DNA primase